MAGNGSALASYYGDDGPASAALLSSPGGIAVGSDGSVFVSDTGNNVVRVINASTGNISRYAGTGVARLGADGVAATTSELSAVRAVKVDSFGTLYICDGSRIRAVSAVDHVIRTIAGSAGGLPFSLTNDMPTYGDGGPATDALLAYPADIAIVNIGGHSLVFIADSSSNSIRLVNGSNPLMNATISTAAGVASYGYSGEGLPATRSLLGGPVGIAASANSYFIADSVSHRIQKVLPNGLLFTVGSPPATSVLSRICEYAVIVHFEWSMRMLIEFNFNRRRRQQLTSRTITLSLISILN